MIKKVRSKYFPILINLDEFKVLVIGGGNIATRKVQDLMEFNKKVTIISPVISKQLKDLVKSEGLKWIKREFKPGDTKKFNLVFASTDNPQVDKEIYLECQVTGTLLNVADVPELCNFIMPANIKRGDLTLSIASQGKAPFYVKHLKDKLSEQFDENSGMKLEVASLLRDKMMQSGVYHNSEKRNKIIDEFLKLNLNDLISELRISEIEVVVLKIIEKYTV